MSPTTLFTVQFTFSLVVFGLVTKWYISPLLDARSTRVALVPLFLVQALRYLPSSAFAPGQISDRVPMKAMETIAYGDLGSAVLAIVAAIVLYYRWPHAITVAWIVNVVTSVDWIVAGYVAATSELVTYPMGGNWYIMNYYVPVIGVIHLKIFGCLLNNKEAADGAVPGTG